MFQTPQRFKAIITKCEENVEQGDDGQSMTLSRQHSKWDDGGGG